MTVKGKLFVLEITATGLAILSLTGSVLVTSYLIITEKRAPLFRESTSKLRSKAGSEAKVSIIIPARNEEKVIGSCLDSLCAQTHQNLEIIVVDDSSTDGTKQVVANTANTCRNLRLISTGSKPSGWVGKTWPCWKGYQESSGEFLLFVDADSKLEPSLAELCLAYALEKNVDMLSLSPRIGMSGFWTSAVLPIISGAINLLYPMEKVNNKDSKRAYVFGTFIFVKREVYEKTGGHQAVYQELVEDAAIARLTKSLGFNLRIERGPEYLSTEWEHEPKSIYAGLERVTSSSIKEYGIVSILNAVLVFFLGLYPVFFVVSYLLVFPLDFILKVGFAACAINIMCFMLLVSFELRRISGKISYFPILYPIGVFMFFLAIISSSLKIHRGKEISWKGQGYIQSETDKPRSLHI